MKRVVTAALMRAMDRETIEEREVPGYDLMTAAGREVAHSILEHFDAEDGELVIILCGKGNNGGDGFVTAALLKDAGASVLAMLVGAAPGDLKGDAKQAHADWEEAGGETRAVRSEADWEKARPLLEEADLVVDALLGTGTTGEPRGIVGYVIDDLRDIEAPQVSIDIPSGIDADTGAAPGAFVDADLTVTLALPKRGLVLFPGRAAAGHVEIVDIGIPEDVLESGDGLRVEVPEALDLAVRLPRRHPTMHKGDRGRLLVVGGSAGLTGAVALAADAAVRAGAGLVTVGVPMGLQDVMATKLIEAMTLALPQIQTRALSREAFDPVALFQAGKVDALALGSGAGRHRSTLSLFQRIVEELPVPFVLDADGLHAFAGEADLLRNTASPKAPVLTPHVGEFAALTGADPEEIEADRIEIASTWARRLGTVIVLKGAPTVIADPAEERVVVNPTGSETLATGGTGDVLAGFIAGFLAQGLDPIDAALVGVFVHGLTADYVESEWGTGYGLRARDLIDAFPLALGHLFG